MNFLFAWKYFKSKKSTTAVNIIAWISIVAIAVGTAALIIILSVFNGFEDLVKGLYGDFYADAKITASIGKTITLTPQQIATIKKVNGVQAISFIAEEKALLVNGDYQTTVVLRGVDDDFKTVNKIGNHIISGEYALGSKEKPSIVVGAGIQNATAIDAEHSITSCVIYLPNKNISSNASLQSAFNSYNIHAAGTFMVQQEFDNKYAFTNINFVKYMLDMPADVYSNIEIKFALNSNANNIVNQIKAALGSNYIVQTRYQQNQNLYSVMAMEKWIIYGILSLILAVAAFNIIGAITMLVLEKQKDIAVLKALGASHSTIQNIFLKAGFLLAGIGGMAGILIATIICWLQLKFKLLKLAGNSFIIDYYPVQMYWKDYMLVMATIFVIAFLASYIPARKASRQQFLLKS